MELHEAVSLNGTVGPTKMSSHMGWAAVIDAGALEPCFSRPMGRRMVSQSPHLRISATFEEKTSQPLTF